MLAMTFSRCLFTEWSYGTIPTDVFRFVLRHERTHVFRLFLVFSLALILALYRHACDPVEVIVGVLPRTADQKIFLLVNHAGTAIFTHLEIGGQLYRIRGTRLFAKAAENTP